jgi:hypothetical protein
MSWPVAVVMAGAQVLLGVVDGIRDIKATYHPLADLRTYRAWRKKNVV